MQVTETLAEGLRREFKVVVPVTELESKVSTRLDELKGQVRINGFRPGKVPIAHLKRVYGRAVMAEAIEAAVQEANSKIVSDGGFKVAMEPKVTFPEAEGEVKDVVEGKADLAYTVALEILPKIELADFKGIALEKLVAEVDEEEIEGTMKNISNRNRPYNPKGEGAKAETGDRVTINFTGKIDGVPFEGGTGEDIGVEIGSGTFIPGFEDQLIGIAAGEDRTVTVTFPKNYTATNLAGKEAVFDVTAKSIDAPGEVALDDEFAKTLGLESVEKLREAVKDQISKQHVAMTRQRLKRQLLDELDKLHKFELPPTMVEEEFNNVWKTITSDLESQNRNFADEGTTEDAAKAEYRGIAERRVRLGLVLAEIGERNNIKVTDEEVARAVVERARQFPGQEQQVWEHYTKNANALASLRAPIYEEKVVDFLVELARVTEKTVPRQELYKDEDAEKAA